MKRGIQMSENVQPLESENDDASEDGKRQRSSIAFPYADFDSAAALVRSVHDNVGHGTCTAEQLAGWTNQSPKSSGFRTQMAAGR